MTFATRQGARQSQLQARSLHTWRNAGLLVQLGWQTLLEADRAARPGTFTAYVPALDAAAAGELADAHVDFPEAA